MKKFLVMLAAFLLTAVWLAGCGEYKAPVEDGTTTDPGQTVTPPSETDPPINPSTESVFTVKLTYLNHAFSPEETIYAYWNEIDSSRIYKAEFDENGVAEIKGLDGDYKVTLSKVPEGYTYDPNSDNNIATNDFKDVTINLMRLTQTSGTGAGFNNGRITITANGAYRATLTSPEQQLHYYFTPTVSGAYSIVSLIDVTANVINPILDIYAVNAGGFYLFMETRDGGGSENTFTKNFKWEMTLAQESVNSSFGFVIRADSLSAEAFPVDIDFYVDKDGEFISSKTEYVPVPVTEDFKQTPNYSSAFRYIAYENSQHILDETLVRFNDEIGYYCMYDNVLNDFKRYADGTPVILYVKITMSTEVISDAFTYGLVRKKIRGRDYEEMVASYAEYCNKDGVYALTEEFKAFLMDYANSQLLFNDGNGMAEAIGYNSTLSAQWLFACGYYPTK